MERVINYENKQETTINVAKEVVNEAKKVERPTAKAINNVNPRKSKLDSVELLNDFVKKLNAGCEASDIARFYEVTIKDTKLSSAVRVGSDKKNGKSKTIRLVMYDLETKERMTLFSTDYVFKNPSEVLNSDYQKVLIRELLYTSFASTVFTLESTIKSQKVNELFKDGHRDNGDSSEASKEV